MEKRVYGWGINDVDYDVVRTETVKGKRKQVWRCPYYQKWVSILQRCFDHKSQEKHPTYKDCTVTEEWKYLSNFIKWVDSQPNRDWMDCNADKDFLSVDNKRYSPDTVVFVSSMINGFILDRGRARGICMIGACYKPYNSKSNPYEAKCCNPFGGSGYAGIFSTELEAHKAWQAKKHQYACLLADMQEDERIASRLREMYAPDKDWTDR